MATSYRFDPDYQHQLVASDISLATSFSISLQSSSRAHSAAPRFRKKSRAARLLGCKRPHNGSLSLLTFCECLRLKLTAPAQNSPRQTVAGFFHRGLCPLCGGNFLRSAIKIPCFPPQGSVGRCPSACRRETGFPLLSNRAFCFV